ncbi:hypothetical protein UW989_00750 [Aeromonas caviae]|uniref:hypothetical protein n=1 Tax=Aeromonas TaxID=642 RepID=UPI00227BD9BB|nr:MULTISPECIES: hypothetical protein [Aeromonas]MDY7782321.1 hypothetical protein [Aeromonas caviae]WAF71074.1 hypothetical protein NRK99_13755 [Aeromonas dhakensis]HDZ8883088.1 hypothetical protein [Aeromonas dhakensis]HEH9394636.1 hypothetical protein [Aeromonas salmonicida]
MDQATNTLIALGGGLLIALLGWAFSSSKVETQVVDADDAWSQFDGVTSFQLTFYRQSGNTHRVVQIHGTREDVEAEIRKVFNRAGIRDQYMVGKRGDAIDYCRAYHNHRGSNEGKKVGGCLITAS